MMKEEFLEVAGLKNISDSDYELIETVYVWHPLISDAIGKEQVAELYKNFGIGIFKEMKPKAEEAQRLELELSDALNKADAIKAKLAALKK